MDTNTAVLELMTSLISKQDLESHNPQTFDEVIEIIQATPKDELIKNLENKLKVEEINTQEILKNYLEKDKLDIELDSYQPFCNGR